MALVLTTTALWLWNWTGRWQLSGHPSSDNLIDPVDIPHSVVEPPGSVENHADIDFVNPSHDTNVAADSQLQHSAVIERLFPASAMDSWMVPNREALRDLLFCLDSDGCGSNQRKGVWQNATMLIVVRADQNYRHSVVLLSAYEFRSAWDGGNGGEEVWAAAVVSPYPAYPNALLKWVMTDPSPKKPRLHLLLRLLNVRRSSALPSFSNPCAGHNRQRV